ncbi:MAG: response regulator [Lachnospiraceae bacterium]|nr:response regulator [Lachnospiraceae bacterium]
MDQKKNERFLLTLLTPGGIGLAVVSILMGWEFWVPPLLIIAAVFLWIMHITEQPSPVIRKVCYFLYAVLAVFYHGVHETSMFDISVVILLAMAGFSFLNSIYMLNTFLAEFSILLFIQIVLAVSHSTYDFDKLDNARIVLHICVVLLVYYCCVRIVKDRAERIKSEAEKDDRIEAVDADMEDFLTNISHELRTPVNVVNGMSEMLMKKDVGSEAVSIKTAGVRLAYQIEDIQDYTECKRNKVILEEIDYMSTSLINDVVTSFRLFENEKRLDLIVDLDPMVPTRMHGDVKKIHKIFRHLLENAVKFTRRGGIYVKMFTEKTDYGVNLCIEMTDTGIGMDRKSIASLSQGMYQVNKKRNRSSGGIGLGLFIVYGFAHRMGGFVKIESEPKKGTTVRLTLPQKVTDKTPCLMLSGTFSGDILFHVRMNKYMVPRVRDFYRYMATNLATGIHVPLYSTQSVKEIEHMRKKLNVSYIFMGQEEYEENSEYFDELSMGDVVVAVSAASGFKPDSGSRVLVMPKPLYAYPIIKVLNEGVDAGNLENIAKSERPVFKNVRALVVDDEPMNLVVATGLFSDYEMVIETAGSGREAISKFRSNDYDVVFMDHMMPEMDGVEAMKWIKAIAAEQNKKIIVIALTANAVSGAREMFMKEGFDGFIAKPINIADFERVMLLELSGTVIGKGGQE